MSLRPLIAPLLAVSCQTSSVESSGFGSAPAITTVPASTGGSTTGASTGSGNETASSAVASTSTGNESAGETIASTFDLGTMADFGEKPVGCKGKIDFLFVISREGTMHSAQERLITAFPAFIATIQEKFADFDYHIMVVSGGTEWGASQCNVKCPKPSEDFCGVDDYPCDLLGIVTECDNTIGAGTVFPAGYFASNKPCAVDGGRRFLTREQTDLKGTFACIAQLGQTGAGWIGEALTAAVSPQLNWQGACNEGFLRDDALLMVTMISNTYDEEGKPWGSLGTPEQWTEAVVAAKKGDPESVIMLSILDPVCPFGDRTCEMVKMFPYWFIEDVSVPDWGPAFEKASDLVEVACEAFSPPG